MNHRGGNRSRPYDNTLLNDLHEIMPEALYDSDLFNSPILRFFQQRVGHMFPSYHRERGSYLREQADSRRHAFRSTRLSRIPNPVIQTQPIAPVQTYESTNVSEGFLRGLLLSIMAENATLGSIAPPTPPATTAPASGASADAEDDEDSDSAEGGRIISPPSPLEAEVQHRRIIRTQRSGITVTIPGGTTWWDPVTVRPSVAVYARNTIIMDASSVPTGTVCTVCQSAPGEDLSGATVTDTMWRKLRGCQHYFHKTCADRWFEQHIHCPNCRADIRATQAEVAGAGAGATLDV